MRMPLVAQVVVAHGGVVAPGDGHERLEPGERGGRGWGAGRAAWAVLRSPELIAPRPPINRPPAPCGPPIATLGPASARDPACRPSARPSGRRSSEAEAAAHARSRRHLHEPRAHGGRADQPRERAYDIFSRLLKERIIFVNGPVHDWHEPAGRRPAAAPRGGEPFERDLACTSIRPVGEVIGGPERSTTRCSISAPRSAR